MRAAIGVFIAAMIPAAMLWAADPADPLQALSQHRPDTAVQTPSARPEAPDLSNALDKAFRFLDKWQDPQGAWNRIGEMDPTLENDKDWEWRIYDEKEYRDGIIKDRADDQSHVNVADTALAGRAMLLAVAAGTHPEYAPKIKKAIEFLCGQIDRWNTGEMAKAIYIQDRIFDPLHDKAPALGEARYYDPTIDTFFTLAFLARAKAQLTDNALGARVNRALDILRRKIEFNQDNHGTWVDDTDPSAKTNDTVSEVPDVFPHVMGHMFKPAQPRVSPQNMKLPKNNLEKAVLYDTVHKNILVHCEQLRDISIATRLGVDFAMSTRFRAELYLADNFSEGAWAKRSEGPYARDVSPKAILIAAVLAAWYQVDTTARFLADAAQKKADHGEKVDANELGTLRKHAQETHARLAKLVKVFVAYGNLPICGPALEDLPDCLEAVREFDPASADKFGAKLREAMLARQRGEGNFIAGPNDDWRQYEWIGTDRGESIFGTATTLRLLMYLRQQEASPAAPPVTPGAHATGG